MSDDETIYKIAAVRHTLRNVATAMEELVQRASGMTDLTLAHALVLVRLTRMPTCKQVDLKSLPGIGSPHLTRLLDELARRGLVDRSRSSGDRRQVLLSLTDSGREAALRLLRALHTLTDSEWLNALDRLGLRVAQVFASTNA
jgi:DNA-binding MarR family transcriptional regulator